MPLVLLFKNQYQFLKSSWGWMHTIGRNFIFLSLPSTPYLLLHPPANMFTEDPILFSGSTQHTSNYSLDVYPLGHVVISVWAVTRFIRFQYI